MRFREEGQIACGGTKISVLFIEGEKKRNVAGTLCSLEIRRRIGMNERVACDRGYLNDSSEDEIEMGSRVG
jgi:hypothetical protein